MADDPKTMMWTPDGLIPLGQKANERVELRAGVMEWLRQFNDVATALKLGIHCSKCGKDIIGKNSDNDRVYSVACGCREFVGQNRDWRPSASAPVPVH